MSNRSVNFLAAAFAAVLAGANLATVTEIRAQAAAADTCLTAPKDKTPAGSRWRYRLERGTGRQCWYLKDESDKAARAAPQEPVGLSPEAAAAESSAADPVPPQPRPVVRKSISNAHAELTPPRARAEQDRTGPRSRAAEQRSASRPLHPNSEPPGRNHAGHSRACIDSRDALARYDGHESVQRFRYRRRRTGVQSAGDRPAGIAARAATGCSSRRRRIHRWPSSPRRCRCCSW